MAYKANRFFDDTTTVFVPTAQVGGEIPVGVESATKFRVDATLSAGVATDIQLETHVGGDVWVIFGTLSGTTTGTFTPPDLLVPLGSKVRLKVRAAGANVTVTKAYITLSR